jgi:hypothetical protein
MSRRGQQPKAPERKFIRPLMVDVGRGEEPAVLKFKRGPGNVVLVPKEGLSVIWEGREGRFWRRRVDEGAAEIAEPPGGDEPKAHRRADKTTDKPKGEGT